MKQLAFDPSRQHVESTTSGEEMKRFLLAAIVVFVLLASGRADAQTTDPQLGLPELHVIKRVTLSPSYSCRPAGKSGTPYEGPALFLSAYSKQRNSPDMLFNGACRSDDYFMASTGGDDMSLIADLGVGIKLEEVSALKAFNLRRVAADEAYSKFVDKVKVERNHTYAVLLNESDKRGLFIFTVTGYIPNERVDLNYAVKSYQVVTGARFPSEGFDWERKNATLTSQR
jgi:hypothetical protein